jgi:prepilin-type N-terminal cleavage/methylation domain-containing protein
MKTQNKGFTLIELLVVIVVIGLFSGLSILYYNNFNEQKKLESDTEGFKSVFELVRNKALAGDKSPCTTAKNPLQPYQINIVSGTPSYYTINNACITTGSTEMARYPLSSNIIFQTSDTIEFKIAQPGLNSAKSITLKNTFIQKCYTLTIDLSGVINQSALVSCPNS